MAGTMSIKRTIAKADLLRAIEGDGEFSLLAEGNAFAVIRWSNGQENAVFNLVQGEITVGSPTPGAISKMKQLAAEFGADVVGAEENLLTGGRSSVENSVGGFARLAWPMVVVTLVLLLLWRW